MNIIIYVMIYVGSALMAYNIYRYICFSRDIRKHGNWDQEQWLLNLPDEGLAKTPIIAMTANAFQDDIKKAEEVGMNGHIAKPLDIPSMKATLQQVLSSRIAPHREREA